MPRLFQNSLRGVLFLLASFFFHSATAQKNTPESVRTPENHVYQYMYAATCDKWLDSSKTNSTAYLWIPENSSRLEGLVILCTNVPEQMLGGHSYIRKVCEENNLGIVWCCPSFLNFRKSTKNGKTFNMALEHSVTIPFLEELLKGLAKVSGYEEITQIPWLPMGESGHLLMVDALIECKPEKCIAGIYIKNNHITPKNRTVPILTVFGTGQEWSQEKSDIRKKWSENATGYSIITTERRKNNQWPLSYVMDGESGHFDCSEKLTLYMSNYINAIVKMRIQKTKADTIALKEINVSNGFLGHLPVMGYKKSNIVSFSDKDTFMLTAPWYPTTALAKEAQMIASINWNASTQFPAVINDSGNVAPYTFNGIQKVIVSTFEEDGNTFSLGATMLDKIPSNFEHGGEPFAKSTNKPEFEWTSGPLKHLGNGRFALQLDRTYSFTANYIGLRVKGNDSIRSIFQPCAVTVPKNQTGLVQKITFPSIKNVHFGTKSIELSAQSDVSGMKVQYFVVAGPAIISENKLIFTKIPPKSKFPLQVTVGAWQWGRKTEPKVKTAEIVKQSFFIEK